ncbi:MAG: heme exporter protein CcmB [Myxococcales bacterium]|nr:heme exporter protein CcmB [Myxococcales bacterium]MCB9582968.1 heme exporter protein CcmB [Polyangiaceae bacterium]
MVDDPAAEAPLVRGKDRTPPRPPGWWTQATVILGKDLRIEVQSGEVVTTSAFFAALVVVIASFSLFGGPTSKRLVASAVIWLSIAFAAVLSLARAWQREREEGALTGLLVSPVSRSAIFAGKAVGLLSFLAVVEIVVVPLTALLFSVDLLKYSAGLIAIIAVATPGIAATGTLFGAMTVRTRARDLLLAIVLFPLLAPTLLTAVAATRELFGGAPFSELGDYFKLMGVFDVVFVSGGLTLFGTLVES